MAGFLLELHREDPGPALCVLTLQQCPGRAAGVAGEGRAAGFGRRRFGNCRQGRRNLFDRGPGHHRVVRDQRIYPEAGRLLDAGRVIDRPGDNLKAGVMGVRNQGLVDRPLRGNDVDSVVLCDVDRDRVDRVQGEKRGGRLRKNLVKAGQVAHGEGLDDQLGGGDSRSLDRVCDDLGIVKGRVPVVVGRQVLDLDVGLGARLPDQIEKGAQFRHPRWRTRIPGSQFGRDVVDAGYVEYALGSEFGGGDGGDGPRAVGGPVKGVVMDHHRHLVRCQLHVGFEHEPGVGRVQKANNGVLGLGRLAIHQRSAAVGVDPGRRARLGGQRPHRQHRQHQNRKPEPQVKPPPLNPRVRTDPSSGTKDIRARCISRAFGELAPLRRSPRRKMRGLLQSCESRILRFAETPPTLPGRACLDGPRCRARRKKLPPARTATSARRCSAPSTWKSPVAPSARAGRKVSCRRASRCSCSALRAGPIGT